MSSATLYEIKNNIAVISLNSPPVNGLGQAVRESILENFKKAHNDDNVKAIVIASTGKLFCGGADISEFGTDKMTDHQPAICARAIGNRGCRDTGRRYH